MASNDNLTDEDLVRAVIGLADVYEHNGRGMDEDCVRLTILQAKRIAALAQQALEAGVAS